MVWLKYRQLRHRDQQKGREARIRLLHSQPNDFPQVWKASKGERADIFSSRCWVNDCERPHVKDWN